MRPFLLWLAFIATPASAESSWTASLSGGGSTIAHQPDQSLLSTSLTRDIGDGFVRLGVTRVDGGNLGGLGGTLPATTTEATLAGGVSLGNLDLDAYALAGQRHFDARSFRGANGAMLALGGKGDVLGLGATATWNAPLGKGWFLSPFASLDFSRIDTARVLTPAMGAPVVREQREHGTTLSGGATFSRNFGKSSAGLYAAAVHASNAAAVNRAAGATAAQRVLGLLDAGGGKDGWAEYGALAALALSPRVSLDLSLVRTAGVRAGESTSGSAGLRVRF